MGIRTVLVVGARIAGSTAACLLGRRGSAVTVVERTGGSPVDVRGPALRVIGRMGLLPTIRARATRTTRLAAVDGNGATIGWIPPRPDRGRSRSPRRSRRDPDRRAREHTESRYDDTVTGPARTTTGCA